jgi:hypothetical protein
LAAKPAGVSDTPYTMRTYRGKLYVGFSRQIWRLKSDFTWDGSAAFYIAEDVDFLLHSEVHLGFLYFVSRNGHVLRTDANNTFDMWSFEPGVYIAGMRSFDGRLFLSVNEPLDGTGVIEAALYQMTGSAVTELKRWGNVARNISSGRLRVIGKRMYFSGGSLLGMGSLNGFGIACYDPIEDAYHLFSSCEDATTFPGGSSGTDWIVDDIIFFKGWIYSSVRGHGIFRTKFSYRDVSRYQALYDTTAAGGSVASQNGGWYQSSDFDAGTPGLLTLWNAVTIHVDLPNASTSYVLDYSLDGGATWVTVGNEVGDGTTIRRSTVWVLGTGTPKVGIKASRFKYRITLRTTDTTRSPQLRGVIVRYLPLPEPSWQWEMSLVVTESQQLLDASIDELDSSELATATQTIENAFRNQVPVNYIDIDSTQWTTSDGAGVLITGFSKQLGPVGPTSDGGIESVLKVTLLEAVEAY